MNLSAVLLTWMHQLVRGRLHAARGQNLIEYGLLVATIAIVSAAAFKALSNAEVAYFQGVQPGLAPTPATFSPFVVQHPTNVVFSCPPSARVGTAVACTVSVLDTASSGQTPPAGTVSLSASSGSVSPSSCPLAPASGSTSSCSITFTASAVGPATITGSYAPGGDTAHAASTGTFTITVTPRDTTTTIGGCNPGSQSIPVNGSISCTVTVQDSASGGAATPPQGTVALSVTGGTGTFFACTPLSALGGGATSTCGFTYTATAVGSGTHVLTASYTPSDSVHGPSSGNASVSVSARSVDLDVDCTPSSVAVNAPTTCTAKVTDTAAPTASTPQGTISWSNGVGAAAGNFTATCASLAPVSGSNPPASRCQATYVPSATGNQTIRATYNPTDAHASKTGSGPLTVSTRSTSTQLTCTPSTVGFPATPATGGAPGTGAGQATCTALVTDTAPPPTSTPTGSVTWSVSGSGTLSATTCSLASGQCAVTFTANANGSAIIAASYNPVPTDTAHAPSSAPNTSITVPARPSAPTGLTTTVLPGHNVRLTWNQVAGATGYNVYRSTSTNTEVLIAGNVGTCSNGTCTFTDTTASNNTTYFYKITAIDPSESGASNEASATT